MASPFPEKNPRANTQRKAMKHIFTPNFILEGEKDTIFDLKKQ